MVTIIRRTVFDHMKGMQFWLLLAFSVILFITNGLLFSGRYEESRAQYNREVAWFHPSTRQQVIPVPPSSLGFIYDGGSSGMPVRYKIEPDGVITPETENSTNVKLPVVPPLDWTFIITIVFTLFVALFGYDAVSGEREDETLKLTLSNTVSRVQFGAAKYCAILCVSTVAFLMGAIADILLIGAFRHELLTVDTFVSAGAIIGATLLLCSLFAFLSIMVSAFSHSSPVALLILLVIWACFTIIIPNTAPVIARSFTSIVSESQTARATQQILRKDVDALMKKVQDDSKNGVYQSREELEKDAYAVYDEVQSRVLRQYEIYNNAMRERDHITRILARISPVTLFSYAIENLTRTGERHDQLFLRAAQNYSEQYDRYILDKVGKLTRQSLWSFMVGFSLNGKEVRISSPFPEEYKGDMRDFPRFQMPAFPLSAGIHAALGDIAGLVIWNLLAAAGAFAAVQRMDVR